jgi:hypothetical protein
MIEKNKGKGGFGEKKLSEELSNQSERIKDFYHLKTNREILEKAFFEHIFFSEPQSKTIDELCLKMGVDRTKFIVPVIDRYIKKTLKNYGIYKEQHKKSAKSESELLLVLQEMVNKYEALPQEKRKFLTASMIQKFIFMNDDKYSQKHINVIKRVLNTPEASFVQDYHNKYNLTVKSNYQRG